ncbi:MAG: YlbF family regulator [Thermoanaerobaculaceae bacterium]|nr:YlbF family regulator [Thermoanaerobaculaceae bacterium]
MATTVPQTALTVAEAAEVLARAIHDSAEWRRWSDARERFDADPQLRQMQQRLAELSRKFQSARAQGRGLCGPDLAELNRLQSEVQASPLARARDEAAAALIQFLQDTNRLLSDTLGVDFAANAAPRQSSCCG